MGGSPQIRHPGRRRRSAEATWLVALLAAAAALLTLAVAFPMSERAPVRLGVAGAVVAVIMAAATWTLAQRLPRRVLLGEVVFAAVANSVLVAEAHTREGAIGDAFAYGWLALYVAIFFPRCAAWFSALVAAGYGAGLLAGELPGMAPAWGVVAVSVAALGALTAQVTGALRRQAETDPLTGAANRSGLQRAVDELALRPARAPHPITVAAWDLDGFKAVNDRHGHSGGDRLLTEAVDAWHGILRRGDVLSRVGGDEFVLVMPATAPAEAQLILKRLEHAHPVAWSAGIAEWRAGERLEDCIRRADDRLYAAKARRRAAA